MHDIINTRFLGQSARVGSLDTLNKEYDKCLKLLFDLQEKINGYQSSRSTLLTSGELSAFYARWPSVAFCGGNTAYLALSASAQCVSFYTTRPSNGSSDQYVYTTLPLYSLSIDMASPNNPRIKPEGRTTGHPHGNDLNNAGYYNTICVGSNEFLELYRSTSITHDQLIYMLDSMMVWLTTANLADMYGNSFISGDSISEYHLERHTQEINNLFAAAMQFAVKGTGVSSEFYADFRELSKSMNPDFQDCSNAEFSPKTIGAVFLHAFVVIYAMWLCIHPEFLVRNLGKTCLLDALYTDICTHIKQYPYNNVLLTTKKSRERILNGPRKLKWYLNYIGQNTSCLDVIPDEPITFGG